MSDKAEKAKSNINGSEIEGLYDYGDITEHFKHSR